MFDAISTKLKLPLDAPAFPESETTSKTNAPQAVTGQAGDVNRAAVTREGPMNTNINAQDTVPTLSSTPAHTTLSSIDSVLLEDQLPLNFDLFGDFEQFSLDGFFDSDSIPMWSYENSDL